ncbi:MAG: hypothetical protein K0S04_78 [Herbinix sp.]|jgi:hypothetical protein|nr:hypothetical protein [Herbinix sp.]
MVNMPKFTFRAVCGRVDKEFDITHNPKMLIKCCKT